MISKNIIIQAIKERKVVTFFYNGGNRIVEPHLIGKKSTGNVALSGWQTGGYSESQNMPPWRNYLIEDITNFEISDQPFNGTRPGYNRNDTTMEAIYYRL